MSKILSYGIILLLLAGCFPTRHLKEGEKLLVKAKIDVEDKSKVNSSDLDEYLRQKPNRKIFGFFRFHLALYNAVDDEKLAKKTAQRKEKLAKKNAEIKAENEERKAKGKPPKKVKEYKPHWREKWKNKIGEKPAIFDSAKTEATLKQMKLHFFKKGYYDAEGHFTTKQPFLSKKKVKVFYHLHPGEPYVISDYERIINDTLIKAHVTHLKNHNKLPVKEGKNVDIDVLDKEREIITEQLNNNGYYEFNKEYLTYQIDTNQSEHLADLKLFLNKPKEKQLTTDSILTLEHRQFVIESIDVNVFGGTSEEVSTPILSKYKSITFRQYNTKKTIKEVEVTRNILFEEQALYNLSLITQTRKKLVSTGLFENVQILFEKTGDDGLRKGQLKCVINLKLLKKQSLRAESSGTHTNGNYGIEGGLSYTNRNLFKGGEKLELSIAGGLQTQRSFTSQEEDDLSRLNRTINTFEIGPELKFSLPRILFFNDYFTRADLTETSIRADMNWQTTPDFNRQIDEIFFDYKWEKDQHGFLLSPIQVSFVDIEITNPEFQSRLANTNNVALQNSFRSHVNVGLRFQHGFTKRQRKSAFFISSSIEGVGNTMKLIYESFDIMPNSRGNFEFFGIEFAQFVKLQSEVRFHYNIAESNDLAFRFNGGLGVPFQNSNFALPFEKSFYIGGPNSLRAWKIRTLGPGAYTTEQRSFDKIGDIILEGNAEYRFRLTGTFEGALFIDAGNIWMYDKNTTQIGGNFTFNTFANQIALGSGFGLRFDLSYFLLRFDLAFPLKTPYLPDGQKWVFQEQTVEGRHFLPQLNFGIGYPF